MNKPQKEKQMGISVFSYYLPSRVTTLNKLPSSVIKSDKKMLRDFGFRNIHIAENENGYEMALKAAKKVFQKHVVAPEDINVLVYSSALPNIKSRVESSHDPIKLFKYPAMELQYKLGLTHATTFAISQAGCVSLFQSIRVGEDLLRGEKDLQHILCVSSDALPTYAGREILYNLISDGACAVVVSRSSIRNHIIAQFQITKGFFWDSNKNNNEMIASYFPTAKFVIEETLKRARLSLADIALIIPHNVNKKSWEILSKIINIPQERLFLRNIGRVGHTIAADAIINFSDAIDAGLVKKGDYVLMFTFGFGAHWACMIIQH